MNAIGGNVLRLRRARGLTQGQLADQLGVSSAAVSKWETGGALPDTALLCPLARALGCSADELLGFKPELAAGEIEALCKAPRALLDAGDWGGALAFCRQKLREYPGDLPLRFQLGFLLAHGAGRCAGPAGAAALRRQAAELFEQATALPDEEQRRAAWRMLARLWADEGQYQKALTALGNLPSCNQEGQGLRADILRRMGDLDGAEKLETGSLAAQLAALKHTLRSLADTKRARGDEAGAKGYDEKAARLAALFGPPASPGGAPAGEGCLACGPGGAERGDRDETEI